MTPEQIEFLATIEEMRAPTAHILDWVDGIRNECESPLTEHQRQTIAEIETRALRLQTWLTMIAESPIMPANIADWHYCAFDIGGPIGSMLGYTLTLLLDLADEKPARRPDWQSRIEDIRFGAEYLLRLRGILMLATTRLSQVQDTWMHRI